MKRLAAAAMLLFVLLSLVPAPRTAAASDVIFTAVNDVFVSNLSADTMPVRIGSQMYVPHSTLARLLTVKTYYNEKEQRLLVYNFDHVLTFDLANSITYDETGVVYSHNAVRRSGTVFVPAPLVCEKFGYYYSYITSAPLGPVVRINSEAVTVPDSVLIEKAQGRMQQIYDAYIASTAPDPGGQTDPDLPPADPDQPEPGDPEYSPSVYLAFTGEPGSDAGAVLDALAQSQTTAAFFVSGDLAACRQTLRRIFSEGHTLGLYAPGPHTSAEALLSGLEQQNELLSEILHTKTRLVFIPGCRSLAQSTRDALAAAGYRLWEDNVDPRSESRSGYSVRVNVRNMVSGMQYSAVVKLLCNASSAEALPGIVRDLQSAGSELLTIREWDTPINSAREIR